MSLIPNWVWIVAAILLGVLSVTSIGVMAKRRTLIDLGKMIL